VIDFLTDLGLFPHQASTMAGRVDALYGFLIALTAFFSLLIGSLIVAFSIRYRRRAATDYTPQVGDVEIGSWKLEVAWTVIPFFIAMGIFAWGANLYVAMARPPADALEIFAVGKQWMWKLQHMEGRREINELHVPVGRAVKLTMTSEDVIHSFFVPAFRLKADVLPGRYTTMWFEPTATGVYHLFCAEYCGTEHSRMIGRVVVMPPTDYQDWLRGAASGVSEGAGPLRSAALSMPALGQDLFERNGCRTCHATSAAEGATAATGPPLYGLFGRTVELENGYSVVAEEQYLRRSILDPMTEIVQGYRPMMPTYAGRLSEEDVLRLVAYIRSIAADLPSAAEIAPPLPEEAPVEPVTEPPPPQGEVAPGAAHGRPAPPAAGAGGAKSEPAAPGPAAAPAREEH
jgi:cytochrome c oxidase subunit 2